MLACFLLLLISGLMVVRDFGCLGFCVVCQGSCNEF